MDTVEVEVDLITPATNAEGRAHAGTVVLASNTQEEAGHVRLITDEADVKSNAEEVAVEVVLDSNVLPVISNAQVSSFSENGSDLGEVPAVVELVVEPAEVGTVEGQNGGTELFSQVGNSGYSLEIEAVVVSDANNTVISAAIPHVDEQGRAGAEEEGTLDRDISSIARLEREDVEVVISDAAAGGSVSITGKDSAADLRFQEGTSIEELQVMNNSEGETANGLVDNVIQLGTGHASAAAMETTVEEVRLTADPEETLNPIDHSTVDINNYNAPQLEISEVLTTVDQCDDFTAIAEELSGTKSFVTKMVFAGSAGEKPKAAKLDSKSSVKPDTRDTAMEQLGGIIEVTSITSTDDLIEENLGTGVVDDRGEELQLMNENVGLISIGEIGEIALATNLGEKAELSNFEEIEINEISWVQLVETTENLGPTKKTNAEIRLSTDEVETSLETAMEILIESPGDKIEDPQGSNSNIGTSPEETLSKAAGEKLEVTRVKTLQEMMPKVTKEAGVSLDETMNDVINPVDTMVVEKPEDTEPVNPPAATQEGEGLAAITKSIVQGDESADAADDDLTDSEECPVAVEETIDTTISIPTSQQEIGEAETEDRDSHGMLIGVGSSVKSSGLTITEIADTTVTVQEFQVEQQSVWGLSDPLITPPEEDIMDAIGNLFGAVDDVADTDESPKTMEILVSMVTEDDAKYESYDLKTSSDGETHTPSESNTGNPNSQLASQSTKVDILDDFERQTTSGSVVVDMAEPLDLPDESFLLPTPRETEMGTGDITPLTTPLDNMQPTDLAAEDIILQDGSVTGPLYGSPSIAEGGHLAREDQDLSLSNEEVRSEAVAEAGTRLTPAFESNLVSIPMSSCGEDELSSMLESATGMVEQVTRVLQDHISEGDASYLVAPITSELGFDSKKAGVDNSVLTSEAKPMEPTEASVFAPVVEDGMDGRSNEQSGCTAVVEDDMDGRSNEQIVGCALDGSVYVVVDGLETVESLERNEKKRGREEESDAVAEDTEKINKAARTSNGEISVLTDVEANDVKIGEDVQVDKKRSREVVLEAVSENPDVAIQKKVQKTGPVDDNPVSQLRKVDTEEADVVDCVDIEDKEGSHEKSLTRRGQDSAAPRYKKRRIAIFLGYSGAGYQGMQKNPGAITIEGELEEALFRAGAISESNYGQPQKLDWRRAARTDKGVSAVGQVVSGNFVVDPPGFIDRVNSHLPKQIRAYGYKRATASFNAKKLCDRRKYEYVLPVYGFDPTVHLDRETAQALAAAEKGNSLNETEMKATTETEVSDPAVETEVSVVIEREIKDTIIEEESTGTLVEPVGEAIVSLLTDVTNIAVPKIESKEGNQSSSNGMSAVTEEVTTVTEIAHENVAAGEKVLETAVNRRPEEKQDVDEKASVALVEVLVQTNEVSRERTEVTVPDPETVIDLSAEGKKEALDGKVKKSTYKFDEAEFNRLNRILKGFEGHHNFHNFTARTKATDPSANRYIISFGVENTLTINGIEFVRCSVVGQSFMIHQIRKMIGLAVAIMRGTAPESILPVALRRDTKINVPMAPELGLFLEECYYSSYNRRFKATHEELSLTTFSAEVNEFKKEFIYPHIGSTEARDSTFAMWLHSLNDRHYPDFVAAREGEKLIKSQ